MKDGKPLLEGDLLEEYYTNLHGAYTAMRHAFQFRGITQDEIARRLGADKGLISRRLNGQENLTLKTLSFMASAMMCTLTIAFTPYEEVSIDEYNDSTQHSAELFLFGKNNSDTADEGEPLRKAA